MTGRGPARRGRGGGAWQRLLDSLGQFYSALLLQEDIEEEQRTLNLRSRMQQAVQLAIPVLLTSLVLNAISLLVLMRSAAPGHRPAATLAAGGLLAAEILSLALFLVMGSLHLRAGIWFGIFHVTTGCGALAATLTYSHSPWLYLWLGFMLGLSTSFCFGWSRAWYQVGLSYVVLLLFGTYHVTRLYEAGVEPAILHASLEFLLPNVAGFFVGLYGYHGYVAWSLFAAIVYCVAALFPSSAPSLLKWGPLHLDSSPQFILPMLSRHLLLAYDQDPGAALAEVDFIFCKRAAQDAVATAALDRFLLRELRRVSGAEGLRRVRDTIVVRDRWHRRASPEMRELIEEVLRDDPGGPEWSREALRRLESVTKDWGRGSSLQKELRFLVNRWLNREPEPDL